MDESTRESLNFLLVAVVTLAGFGLFTSFVLPQWLHGHPLFVAATIVAAFVVAHRLTDDGIVAELGLSPLPPEDDDAPDAAPERPDRQGATPKERVGEE